MSGWLKSLVGYMMIVSVAMQMIPNQKYEQYVRLFTGFLLIVLVLQPILKIGSADSFLEQQISEFVQQQDRLEEEIGAQGETFRLKSEKMQENNEESIKIQQIEQVRVEVTMDD